MQNHPQRVGDDRDRVQNFQVGLIRHVVGDPLGFVGDPLQVIGNPLVWCFKKAISWLNETLSLLVFLMGFQLG